MGNRVSSREFRSCIANCTSKTSGNFNGVSWSVFIATVRSRSHPYTVLTERFAVREELHSHVDAILAHAKPKQACIFDSTTVKLGCLPRNASINSLYIDSRHSCALRPSPRGNISFRMYRHAGAGGSGVTQRVNKVNGSQEGNLNEFER